MSLAMTPEGASGLEYCRRQSHSRVDRAFGLANVGKMQRAYDVQVSRALALHRSGHIPEAKELYARLFLENNRDAYLTGLLGVVALQEDDRAEAERLWRRSLGLACEAAVYIGNLNNLAATLFEDGRNDEAAQLLREAEFRRGAGSNRRMSGN